MRGKGKSSHEINSADLFTLPSPKEIIHEVRNVCERLSGGESNAAFTVVTLIPIVLAISCTRLLNATW